jgi:16S rRNA (adenine1518-N6/adenine1519-N6)-dimethyltransferase
VKHRPRKRFGQNFLQSPAIIHHILAALNLQMADKVVEIGPGMGALTQPLIEQLQHLIAIEIDRDLQAHLQSSLHLKERLELINGDALEVDYRQWGSDLRVIGNLPYNISTPLILHLLSFADSIKDMHFMLQKEVVERLAGQPGSKDYGRLSVMVQYHCEVEHLFNVPAESFHPQPKVESAVVRLIPHSLSPFPAVNIETLQRVVAMAFSMRRKTLANNLKPIIRATELHELDIDPGLRPEQISVMNFVKLTNFITNTAIVF